MSLYTMKLSDSVDTMEFNLLEVPIQDKDIEGAVDNVVLSGDIYTDFLWLKKRFTHKWSILCKDDYERLRGFYTRQFSNAEVPIYQLLDAPSPVEESAGSGEYIQITTTDSTAKLASVEMLGKAEQTTYSGKNLFDYASASDTANTIVSTYRIFEIGGLTPSATYTLSNLKFTSGIDGKHVYLWSTPSYPGGITSFIEIPGNYRNTLQHNSNSDGKIYLAIYPTDASTWNQLIPYFENAQLELGSTATAYEPYVGGTPAPNPEFPMPISVVTGENVVKITGKNLFDKNAITSGKLIDRNTAVLNNNSSYGTSDFVAVKAGEQYTYTGFNYWYACGFNSAKEWVSLLPNSATITIPEGVSYIRASLLLTNLDTAQLELGATATTYEPYQAQEFEVNLGKNLLDPDSISQGTWINASLTNTCTFFVPIFTGETFTISNQDTSTYRFSCGLCATPHAGTNTQDSGWQTGTSYTITAQSNGYLYVQLRKNDASTITPSTTPTNVYMIERGSQATSYSAYFTPLELAKIGNYQDRIYKSEGKWYIEKQVGKLIYDGSENWGQSANQQTGYYRTYATSKKFGRPNDGTFVPITNFITDHFQNNNGILEEQKNYISSTGYATYLKISDSIANTIDGLKTWLSTHNTIVYYALATPTTTEITNEALIAQLDALESASLYLGVNNIGTETLSATPTLALTYFPYYPHEIISPKAVRMELTDGGIINACECRENVQITLRETIQ